jgi:cAMP-dependent protein kinase regulator
MAEANVSSLFDVADLAFHRGQWRPALAAFGGVVKAHPEHFKSRFRIADCLLNVGRRDLALEVYKSLAWHGIKGGHPLLGLVAVKMVILLEPVYEDILYVLAETYSKESDRVSPFHPRPDYPELDDREAAPLSEDGDDLIEEAARLAVFDDANVEYPQKLPTIPLFSHLDEDSFIEVLSKLKLRRYADDEIVIRQGERGESFYMVADGDVSVVRDRDGDDRVVLGQLHRGSVFGEMALISDEPRQASAIAKGDVDVLEMRRSDLVVAASHIEGVTKALKAFTRERFLGNLTATHPFFTSFSKDERHRVMEQFVPVSFSEGDELILEGEAGPGLFLLLGGSADVSKDAGEERVHLATLRAADLCGEMSLIYDQPTSANVIAGEELEALFLSRTDFMAIIDDHPEVRAYLAGINDQRLRQNRALLHSKGLLEDDEHIMI